MNNKKHIKNLSAAELISETIELGIPKYRAAQIHTAVYSDRITSFDEITTLPKDLRAKLSEIYYIDSLTAAEIQKSSDRTSKYLFKLIKGSAVESVLIPEFDEDEEGKLIRNTLCVSSQVGCAMDCAFCATGKLKFGRNLEAGEIIDQVLMVEKLSGEKITNIVFMGMGEPLHNLENVVKAIDMLSAGDPPIVSRKKITVSTSGIVPKINEMAELCKPVKLAVSLHATTNGLREKLMPVARKWKIEELRESITDYYRKTKIPLTFEYIMFDGLNDSAGDAARLARFVRACPSKVNIIPFHDISFTAPTGFAKELKPSPKEKIISFAAELRNLGVHVFIRNSAGFDIDAACGQLAYSKKK